jgi:hypothetical protein
MDTSHPSAKLKGPLDLPTMRQSEYDTFRYGYTYAMKSLLRNCKTCSPYITELFVDGSQLSPSMRDVISTLATGHLANRPLKPTTWKPPNWYDVEDDLYERCLNAENLVPLGLLNGDFLELRLRGYALFQGEGERDLHGFCTLTIKNNEVMQKIECQTLGTVSGTGTAALLDDDSNVWLYNGKLQSINVFLIFLNKWQ